VKSMHIICTCILIQGIAYKRMGTRDSEIVLPEFGLIPVPNRI